MSKAANNPELHDQQTRSMRACSTQALAEARDTAAHAITQERKHIERRNVVAIFAMVVVLLVVAAIELACGASADRYPHQHRSAVRSGERKRYRGCARHPPAARRVRHHLGRGACYCRRGAAECARKPARLSFHGGHLTGRRLWRHVRDPYGGPRYHRFECQCEHGHDRSLRLRGCYDIEPGRARILAFGPAAPRKHHLGWRGALCPFRGCFDHHPILRRRC